MMKRIVDINGISNGAMLSVTEKLVVMCEKFVSNGFFTGDIYELPDILPQSKSQEYCTRLGVDRHSVEFTDHLTYNFFGIDEEGTIIMYHDLDEFGIGDDFSKLVVHWKDLINPIVSPTGSEGNDSSSDKPITNAQRFLDLRSFISTSNSNLLNMVSQVSSVRRQYVNGGDAVEVTFSDKSVLSFTGLKSTIFGESDITCQEGALIKYPHYRKFESGMIAVITSETTGIVIEVPEGDHREIGKVLTPLYQGEGVIVSANFKEGVL